MWLASVAENIQFTNGEVGLFVCEILFLNLFWLHLLLQLSWHNSQIVSSTYLDKISFQIVKNSKTEKVQLWMHFL